MVCVSNGRADRAGKMNMGKYPGFDLFPYLPDEPAVIQFGHFSKIFMAVVNKHGFLNCGCQVNCRERIKII